MGGLTKKTLKITSKIVLVSMISVVLYLNLALFYAPKFENSNSSIYNLSVYHQLTFLKSKMQEQAGSDMQKMFPEGFIFINALYGLSWCNLITNLENSTSIYKEGIEEIQWSFQQINSDEGKSIFNKNLPLQYGAFYTSWANILLGTMLSLQHPDYRNIENTQLFQQNCQAIAKALEASNSPFLESYSNQAWPADMMGAIVSLQIHDKIFDAKYEDLIQNWILDIQQKLDPLTGLIPHQVHSNTGTSIEAARGSSQSLILNFLYEIDSEFASEQFLIYKKLFLDYRIGLPGIQEYPGNETGAGDIDSGPVIWKIGAAASIVGQRTMYKFGELPVYAGIRNSIETFGVGLTFNSQKAYLFGQLPMADAFIAWSNSIETTEMATSQDWKWRILFQFVSILFIGFFLFLFLKL